MRLLSCCVLLLVALSVQAAPPPRFPDAAVWHQRIDAAPLHPQSASMISTLQSLGGWGNADRFMVDNAWFHVAHAEPDAPRYPVVEHKTYGDYLLPQCDAPGIEVPVPPEAAFGGENGLSCDNSAGDCYLLVVQGNQLYEVYSGNLAGGELDALCVVVWDLRVVYPPEGRGDSCHSTDTGGFPIAPLLPNADGVAAAAALPDGDLGHAIRLALPNDRIATDASLGGSSGRLYVRPASNAAPASGPAGSVPHGARLRLRADFPMDGYNTAAQVILRTMQRYGIVLADAGSIALSFQSDRDTDTTWAALGFDYRAFWDGSPGDREPVRVTDFEVVDTGPRIAQTGACVRTTVAPAPEVFSDGFEA